MGEGELHIPGLHCMSDGDLENQIVTPEASFSFLFYLFSLFKSDTDPNVIPQWYHLNRFIKSEFVFIEFLGKRQP